MISYRQSRLENVDNRHQRQDIYRRTLCVCTAGLLRSPSLAWVLSNPPYNRNTRAAGSESTYALIPVDEALIVWADEIVYANPINAGQVQAKFEVSSNSVYILDLPDRFVYRDPILISIIRKELERVGFPKGIIS